MPRNSNSNSKTTPKSVYAPPPKIWHQSEPLVVQNQTSLFQSMKNGIGLGFGSSIGHSLAGNLFGTAPSVPNPPPQVHYPILNSGNYEYEQCIRMNKDNQGVCIPFLSKDKSPYKQCMEMNNYQFNTCSEPQ